MSILSFLSSALKPVTDLVDNLHTSDDERLEAKAVLLRLRNVVSLEMLGLEKKIIEGQPSITLRRARSQTCPPPNWHPGPTAAGAGGSPGGGARPPRSR